MKKKALFAAIVAWSAANYLIYYSRLPSNRYVEKVLIKAAAFLK